MKVLVCGGRNFRSPAQVFRALDRLHQEKPTTELMQGGATGADQFEMEWTSTKPEIKRYVFPREVCEQALAHVIEDETEAAYRRSDALAKRRMLLDEWAAFCMTDRPCKEHDLSQT